MGKERAGAAPGRRESMSDAEPHSKRQRFTADVATSSSTIDLEEEDQLIVVEPSEAELREEAKLEKASEVQYEKQRQLELKQMSKQSKEAKVERLEHLLQKSVQYSEFLASKIKKEGEGASS